MDSVNDKTKSSKINEFYNYIQKMQSSNVSNQICGIIHIIGHFSRIHDPELDHVFVKNFPQPLLAQFNMLNDDQMKANYDENLVGHLFSVFTFIYRNHNLVNDSTARSFLIIFLKCIKNKERTLTFDIAKLIDSIMICLNIEEHKVYDLNASHVNRLCYAKIKENFNQIW
ncbi:hypothetical protein RF11_14382 [Thelohanellus kitauei]|uniref:Uncharacterized protein n=1 Tax=Thelohanellus kitauei TaxID=669202 RepID=A0A0C2N4T9_THEKT|nr:hypothetical protein RF11_14382 [Thelohanellus kitauei]